MKAVIAAEKQACLLEDSVSNPCSGLRARSLDPRNYAGWHRLPRPGLGSAGACHLILHCLEEAGALTHRSMICCHLVPQTTLAWIISAL